MQVTRMAVQLPLGVCRTAISLLQAGRGQPAPLPDARRGQPPSNARPAASPLRSVCLRAASANWLTSQPPSASATNTIRPVSPGNTPSPSRRKSTRCPRRLWPSGSRTAGRRAGRNAQHPRRDVLRGSGQPRPAGNVYLRYLVGSVACRRTGRTSLTSVSCPTTSFCTAVDSTGQALFDNASTWSAATAIDGSRQLNGVSCTSTSFCIAVDASGN
jgi:hypothetical protein